MKTLALRDDEKTGLMNDASVSTLTFYSGRASESWLRTPGEVGPCVVGQEALVSVMEYCSGGDLRAWLEL